MFNPQVVKLYCMCLRTMRLWSKWLWKAEVQQWDMFPELIGLLFIGCSIELILILRSKSNTSTPKTNSQTFWQRGISHVMNGIICWPCLISAILALLLASQRWQNELNKNQEKDVSQPNHDPWWIWPKKRLRSCFLQPHQTRGGPRLGLFQESNFASDLEDSKSTSGGTLCFLRSRTFVPRSWMCNKQTSVSYTSTESEINSLDAGLRLYGLPALDLWFLIVWSLETQLRTMIERASGGTLCVWKFHSCQSVGREQTSVSHSSTESKMVFP